MAKKRIEDIIESHKGEKSISDTKIEDKKKDNIFKDEEMTLNFNLPLHLYGLIIGKGGQTVNQIRTETKTEIYLSFNNGPVTIIGTKDGVEMAKKRIKDIIESNNSTENEKSANNNAKIEDNKKGNIELVVKDDIFKDEEITLKFNIPQHLHGLIIGRGGQTVNSIKTETKTKIIVRSPVTIIGTKDGVEMAKKRIKDIIESNNSNSTGNEKSANNSAEIVDNKKGDIFKDEEIILKFDIPSHLHGLIIGRGGQTVNQIKTETKTKITVGNPVTIIGTKDGVERAKKRIEDIIESSNPKLPPTHFISIPLTDTHLQRKAEEFRSDVLKLNIDESTLINSQSLHITLGVLNLYRKEDIEGAVRLLKSLSPEISNLIGTRTLVSTLTGLAVMEDDLTRAHVLYTKVEEQKGQKTLEKLGEYLMERFGKAGYLKKENLPLKLHVTLIKTRRGDEHRRPFNAIPILNRFSNIEFGSNRLESIHIAKIGEYDKSGRHYSEGSIKLP